MVSGIIPEDTIDKIVGENIEIIMIGIVVIAEAGIGLEGDHGGDRTRSISNSRSRSGSRASTNRDRIRCYNCREYDHFAGDCPTWREERDIDHLQQMLNLEEEEQTHLSMRTQSNTVENPRTSPLNLWMVGMAPLHSDFLTPK